MISLHKLNEWDLWGFVCADVEIRSLIDQIEACTQDNTPDQNTARTALFHIKPQYLNPTEWSNHKLQTCKMPYFHHHFGYLNLCLNFWWFCCVLSVCLSVCSPDKISEISPLFSATIRFGSSASHRMIDHCSFIIVNWSVTLAFARHRWTQ